MSQICRIQRGRRGEGVGTAGEGWGKCGINEAEQVVCFVEAPEESHLRTGEMNQR
jgi:hypothetical protein